MNVKEFKQILPEYGALIGFDYGSKRLGVAVSDVLRHISSSYKIIYRSSWQKDIAEIKKIIEQKEVCGIVFGLPLQMNGVEGEIALETRKFAQKIAAEVNLPVLFWDERLSSGAVENFLIKEIDMSRQKRKKILDSSAASYILQGALDALNYV